MSLSVLPVLSRKGMERIGRVCCKRSHSMSVTSLVRSVGSCPNTGGGNGPSFDLTGTALLNEEAAISLIFIASRESVPPAAARAVAAAEIDLWGDLGW